MAAIVESKVDAEAGTVEFMVQGEQPIVLRLSDLDDEIVRMAALHGLKQKVGDAGALSRDPETGRSATPAAKYAAMRTVADRLMGDDGEPSWNARAGDAGAGEGGLLVEALVRVTGQDRDTVRETVAAWDKATQAAMRGDAAVAPVIAEIKAERAAKGGAKIDTKALLASAFGG